jgi:hypothetical protein
MLSVYTGLEYNIYVLKVGDSEEKLWSFIFASNTLATLSSGNLVNADFDCNMTSEIEV